MRELFWGAICAFLTSFSSGHREHKVHNIVLYPEKHSWCKTTPIKEVVGHPGCAQIEVDNNVCVGACFSYSIPRTEPTAPGDVLPYCDSCQPTSVSWKHVELSCENDQKMTKKVEVIEDCTCLTCPAPQPPVSKASKEEGEEGPADVPQLLGLLHRSSNQTVHGKLKHAEKLSLLVKMLSEEGEGMGEVQEIISQISDDKHQSLDETQEEDEDQVKVDLGKLRSFLSRMDGHHHHRHHPHVQPSVTLPPQEEDTVEPTLDVLPHHLRPALEGEEITYLADHHKVEELDSNTQAPQEQT